MTREFQPWLRRAQKAALAGVVVAVGLGVWAFGVEPAALRVVEHEVAVETWPEGCDGLRVAILSDLHVGSPWNGQAKLARIVDETLAVEPDLILLPGDFVIGGVVAGRFVTPEAMAVELARLNAPLGVHAVLGNHDWWYDFDRVTKALASAGIATLEDRAIPRRRGACEFWLAGISDFGEGPHDIAHALSRVPGAAAILAFTHNPDVFPEIPSRVDLTFAGHTHGGQVAIPWFGRPIVPSRYQERFAIGHVREAGRDLFVSSGLGTSILPVRFRVPPEISIVRIRREATSSPR